MGRRLIDLAVEHGMAKCQTPHKTLETISHRKPS